MSGVLRMNVPPGPRARSSSGGVLGKDRDNGNPTGTEISTMLGTPSRRKRCGIEPKWSEDGLATTARVSNHEKEADH